MTDAPRISVVLPVCNEGRALPVLKERLVAVLEKVTAGSFEVIFVDDGSTDESPGILDGFCAADARFGVIHFSRNFGHQAALQAGLDRAGGEAVVLMDSDLQDPPEVIEGLAARWAEGAEVVYAVRTRRKEGVFKRAAYAVFYRSLRLMAEIDVPLDAGDFCLLDRRVVDALVALPERNRFLRGLRSWVGFRHVGVTFERAARHSGEPKYTMRKLLRLALSGYVGFSAKPLRAATWLGFVSAASGFLVAAWAILAKIRGETTPVGWASTMATVMLVGGVQLLMLGIIGEYLGRTYDEVRQRPLYVVARARGAGSGGSGPGRDRHGRS